jgi:signal transduction histidine kinase
MVTRVLLILLGACLLASCSGPLPPNVVHYTRAEIQSGQVGAYAPVTDTVDEASLGGNWTPIDLPHIIEKPAAKPGAAASPRVTSWLRVELDELQGMRGQTSLYLIRWLAAGQLAVYADGELVYRSTGSAVWNLFNHPALLLPLKRTTDQPPPRTLLIRLDSLVEPASAISSFYAGDSDYLIARASTRDWFAYQLPFMCSAVFLAVGLFSLAVWLRRRSTPNLLIFVIALTASIRRWHFHLGLEKLPISDAWFIWLTLNALMWQTVALHYYMETLHGRRLRLTGRAMLVVASAFSMVTFPLLAFMPAMLTLRPYAHLVLIGVSTLVMVLGLWNAWRGKSLDARLLAGTFLIAWVFGVYDWARLKYVHDLESYYLTPYAAILLFVVFVIIMFRRYVGALGEVEQLNAGLAQRLRTREAELAESYERLRKVEQQQMLSNERQRLMQDMHDGLGSSLISAIRSVEHGGMSDEEMSQTLKGCVDDLKLAIDSMEPVEADLLLLLATLRFRLEPRLEGTGVKLRWEVRELPALDWLDPSNALHILRILQEAFANILKHTEASEIRVSTAAADDGVAVTIADNGQGFDLASALARGGKGLQNQLRRARFVDGKVDWVSDASGTRLTLWLPQTRGTK